MSEASVASRLIEAAIAYAAEAANTRAPLVSISLEFLSEGDVANVAATITRKTRTLVFVHAEATSRDGARLVTADSVHKVVG
mgnify:CR=1 FL=1